MEERRRVNLYIRVQDQREICIGSARTMSDVPTLLMDIASLLQMGLSPDEIESTVARAAGSSCR